MHPGNILRMNERIYQDDNGAWFYHIRGNQVVGPFDSYDLADHNLNKHVSSCSRRVSAGFQWPRNWSPGRLLRRSAARQA